MTDTPAPSGVPDLLAYVQHLPTCEAVWLDERKRAELRTKFGLVAPDCTCGRNKALAALQAQRARIAELEQELKQWETWGIVEIAVRNPNVSSYMDHWEKRAERAETDSVTLRAAIKAVADEASLALKKLNLTAVPSWLLKLYGLSVERQAAEPKKPWGLRDRQA